MQQIHTVEVTVAIGRYTAAEKFGMQEKFRLVTDDYKKLILVLYDFVQAVHEIRVKRSLKPVRTADRLVTSEIAPEDLPDLGPMPRLEVE
jgi:hypothetical protein